MAGIVASAGAKQIQSGLLSPLQLPGLQLWLDGADPLGTGIAPANTTVSTWADKSGNGRNATGVGSPSYVSANRNVSFNGSQYYTIPYAGTHSTESVFFVLTCTNVSDYQILLVGNVSGTRQILQLAPQIGVTGVGNNASCGNPSINTLSMLEFTFNSSASFAYLNGTAGSAAAGMNPGYESFLYLGCSLSVGTFFTGTISEVLIYNQFLSTYQRQAIEGYLAWKWNIISSLPANHPYRNSAATPSVISTNFFPTYIPGIQLWLDGNDPAGTTVVPANGATITTWADKSGNGFNATTASGTLTYSNGVSSGVAFTGTQFMTTALNSLAPSESAFVVLKFNNLIGEQDILSWNAGGGAARGREYMLLDSQMAWDSTNGLIYYSTAPSAGVTSLVQYTYTTSVLNMYLNSSNTLSNTSITFTPGSQGTVIGSFNGGGYLNGTINEIVVYNSVLTTSQRQVVEGYLAWKWNIQTSLLSNHPFRYFAPNSLSIGGLTNYSYSTSYLPGLTAWYDAADPLGTGFQPANGTVISTWADKTSESLNPMIATGSPTYTTTSQNGLPGITISGNSGTNNTNYFQAYAPPGTFSAELDAFVVYKNTSAVTYNTVLTRSSAAALYCAPLDIYNTAVFAGVYPGSYVQSASSFNLYNETTSILNVTLTQATAASSKITLYRNGTAASLTGDSTGWTPTDTGTHLYLGTRGDKVTGFNGIFYEAMVFNYPLTPTGRQYVEGYLAWKWGLQNSLSTTHPYYAAAPSITTLSFQPTQIFGLNLWLDGADPLNTGILPANGTTISTWADKSPNAFPVTSVGSPTYALATRNITMNGTTQGFSFTYPGVHPTETGFFVLNTTTPNSFQVFITSGLSYSRQFYNYYTALALGQQNIGTNATTTSTITANSNTLLGYSLNSSNSFLYFNGTAGPTGTGFGYVPSESTILIGYSGGGGLYLSGTLSEVILFNTVLTTSERQVVEGYLAWKWGTQVSLPLAHPYKNVQPSLLTFSPSYINTSTIPVIFKPTQISGLDLWLDGADPLNTGILPANGTTISTWADKSSNAFPVTSVGSPTYSLSTRSIALNDSQSFSVPYGGAHLTETAFMVVNLNNPNALRYLILGNAGNGSRSFITYESNIQIQRQNIQNLGYTTTSNLPALSPCLIGYSYNSEAGYAYQNGTVGSFSAAWSSAPLNDTATTIASFPGSVSEVILFNTVLTTFERQQVEGYLAWKWGTQASLPLAHPYKNVQPSKTNTLAIIANADAFLPLQSNTIDYAKTEQIVGSNGTLTFSNVLGKNCIFINGSTTNFISLSIPNPQAFTFAFWFNYTNTNYFTLASYTTPAGAIAMQFDLVSAGSNTVYTALPSQWTIAPGSTNLGSNTWNFIAVTVNQNTYVENLYMNGVLASTATGTGVFPNSPSLMVLGKSGDGTVFPSGGTRSYQGFLQNFMYFNTILTGAQINAIYNETATDLARASQPTSLTLTFTNSTLSFSWTAGINTTSYVVNFYGVSTNTNVGGLFLTTLTTTSTSATYNPGSFNYYYATVIPTNSGFLGTIATSSAVLRT